MDWPAVIDPANPGYSRLWQNIEATLDGRGVVEGHGSGLTTDATICAFAAAGISSDHEVREGQEAWEKLERGLFIETRPDSSHVLRYFVEKGLKDWSNVCVTTDDRNAETTLRRGAMDANIRVAIEAGVEPAIAYAMGSLNTARHFRIDHLVGSITPGRYADLVLLADIEKVVIDRVYADGKLVSVASRPILAVPKIDWPEWATKTVNLGGTIFADDFRVPAPEGRESVTAAILAPFYHEPEFMTATLAVKDGAVQRDAEQAITKVALLDRYTGKKRISKMFWRDVGMRTPHSALCCSIMHDNHNAWVVGSSDEAMALAVNTMAAIDGGFVLVREGQVAAQVRLEVGGLMTARPAEEFARDLLAMRVEMASMDWLEKPDFRLKDFLGVEHVTEALCYGFLTCPPWIWALIPPTDSVPEGLINVVTGETHPVVW
jgi:adenine deaminase